MKTIKLGRKSSEPMAMPSSPSDTHYPSFYVDNVPGVEDLPDEGTMTIRYKVCSKNTNEREGKKTVSLTIDVIAIEQAEEEEIDLDASTSESLDKLAEKVASKLEKEDY